MTVKMGHKAELRYDRRDRLYEVVDRAGSIVARTGSGRLQADWLWLHIEDNDLAQVLRRFAERFPEMETRTQRAGHILLRGMLGPDPDLEPRDPNVYRVFSQSKNYRIYRVYIPSDDLTAWTCTISDNNGLKGEPCPDIANGAPQLTHGKRCKHMTAAYLHRLLNGHGPPPKEEAPTAATVEASKAETVAPANASVPQPAAARKLDRTLARYADGDLVELDDLPAFAGFVARHRRLPHNRDALP